MVVVSDTSAISNLLQISQLNILHALFGTITITPAIQQEIYAIPAQQKEIEKIEWIKVVAPTNNQFITELAEELDLGEAEAIALSIEQKADYLIIDEYAGRKIADTYGVKIIGLLGILIQAKQKNVIREVRPHVENLRQVGFRLNQSLVTEVFKQLGEL
jgi:predicted nucleic acid-binding protein